MLAALTPVKTKPCVYRAAVFLYWVSREVPQYTITPTSWFLYVFQFAVNTCFLLYFISHAKFFFIFSYFHQLHVLKLKKKNHKSYNAENLLSWQTAGFVKCDNVPSQLRHQQVYIMNRIFNTSKAFDIGYYRLQVFFIDLMKYQPRSVYFHQV